MSISQPFVLTKTCNGIFINTTYTLSIPSIVKSSCVSVLIPSAILIAEGHKESAILDAEADKEAMILRAEAAREAKIREAEGEAEAIAKVQKATADAIKMLNEANADESVLKLKALEAFAKAADGQATKIIIPSEIQGMAGLAEGIIESVKK